MSRSTNFFSVVVEPSQFGCAASMDANGRGVLTRTSEILREHPEIELIFTGPIFRDPTIPVSRLLDVAARVDIASARPNHSATISVVQGRAVVHDGAYVPEGASVAVQGHFVVYRRSPLSIYPEKPREHADSAAVWRCAVSLLSNGKILFSIGKTSIHAFALAHQRYNKDGAFVVIALYTDGGHSAILRTRDRSILWGFVGDDPEIFNWLVSRVGAATPMRVYERRTRTRNIQSAVDRSIEQPQSNTSNVGAKALAGIGVLTVTVGAYWLWKNSRKSHKRSS